MDDDKKFTLIENSDPRPENAPLFQVQTGLRAGLFITEDEEFIYSNWDQVKAGIKSFFDRVDARINIFD